MEKHNSLISKLCKGGNSEVVANIFEILAAKIDGLRTKYANTIDPTVLEEIVAIDPTTTNDYSDWLLRMYLKKELNLSDIEKLKEALLQYHLKKSEFISKDINAYKSVDSFYNAVNFIKEKEKLNRSDVEMVFESSKWKVLIPKTRDAAIYYGKDTTWCTSDSDLKRNIFNTFNSLGNLYIVINKKDKERYDKEVEDIIKQKLPVNVMNHHIKHLKRPEKYQFFFTQGEEQYKDPIEKEIDIDDFFEKNPELAKLFYNKEIYLNKLALYPEKITENIANTIVKNKRYDIIIDLFKNQKIDAVLSEKVVSIFINAVVDNIDNPYWKNIIKYFTSSKYTIFPVKPITRLLDFMIKNGMIDEFQSVVFLLDSGNEKIAPVLEFVYNYLKKMKFPKNLEQTFYSLLSKNNLPESIADDVGALLKKGVFKNETEIMEQMVENENLPHLILLEVIKKAVSESNFTVIKNFVDTNETTDYADIVDQIALFTQKHGENYKPSFDSIYSFLAANSYTPVVVLDMLSNIASHNEKAYFLKDVLLSNPILPVKLKKILEISHNED